MADYPMGNVQKTTANPSRHLYLKPCFAIQVKSKLAFGREIPVAAMGEHDHASNACEAGGEHGPNTFHLHLQ